MLLGAWLRFYVFASCVVCFLFALRPYSCFRVVIPVVRLVLVFVFTWFAFVHFWGRVAALYRLMFGLFCLLYMCIAFIGSFAQLSYLFCVSYAIGLRCMGLHRLFIIYIYYIV